MNAADLPHLVIGACMNVHRALGPGLTQDAYEECLAVELRELEFDILPTFTPADFAAKGAVVNGAGLQYGGLLALIELQNGSAAPQYVAGTENFYAITRYNWSSYYAMAVIELGQAVAAAMPK